MNNGWLEKAKRVRKILRPLVKSARKGKKPWQSLTILTNTAAALLVAFNLEAVADVIAHDPDVAKVIAAAWAGLQVYLRIHTKGKVSLRK